jgi:hypothetical protein
MAKTSGLGGVVGVSTAAVGIGTPNDISVDVTNWSFTTPRATQDVTGVNKFANERILALADFTITMNGAFDPAANLEHAVFSTVPSSTAPRTCLVCPISNGSTVTVPVSPYFQVNVILTDYQITRDNTGAITYQVPGSIYDGNNVQWF